LKGEKFMSFAKLVLAGCLGKDPQLSYNKDGKAFCHFSVAVVAKYHKDKDKEKTPESVWYNATCTGGIANVAMAYLKKGHSVYLEGMPSNHLFNGSKGVEISNDLFITNLQLLPNQNNQKAKSNDESEHPEDFNAQEYEQESLEKIQEPIAVVTSKTKAKTS
jgi:single-strand DNA-binding protein